MSKPFEIVKGDTRPYHQETLKIGGSVVDLTGASVVYELKSETGELIIESAATVSDAANGVVQYQWQATDWDNVNFVAGWYRARWRVTYADSTQQSFPTRTYDRVIVRESLVV